MPSLDELINALAEPEPQLSAREPRDPPDILLKIELVRRLALLSQRAFVMKAMTTGMWVPPAGATIDDIFSVTWRWPVVQQAALDRELNSILSMVKEAGLPPSTLLGDYFGMYLDEAARQTVEDKARLKVLGIEIFDAQGGADTPVAQRIMKTVEAEEAWERDLVDQSELDESVLNRSP